MLSLKLEEHNIPTLRLETDNYVYNLFPMYSKLKATDQEERARNLLAGRWNLIHKILASITRKGLRSDYTVIHDHINTTSYKQGIGRRIAKQQKAGHLSILVTAPLEILSERWRQSEITETSLRKVEKTYKHFQTLQGEAQFDLTIDTSQTTPEEAACQIISRIHPEIQLQQAPKPVAQDQQEDAILDIRPRITPGNLQILKDKDTYILVYNHHRYVTDAAGLLILNLCNGHHTLDEIAEIAETDLETTRRTIKFLQRSEMLASSSPLKRPAKPPHPTILRP